MRTFAITMAVGALVAVLGCGAGGAIAQEQEPLSNPPVYLALGDSIPFGDNSNVYPPKNDNVFLVTSYPWYLGQLQDIPVVNAACPGQTSDGFRLLDGTDRGCFWFRDTFDAMHVGYSGAQVDFATRFLSARSRVRFVTFAIGINDVQLLADRCLGDPACIAAGLPDTLGWIGDNMAKSLLAIRSTGYLGQIIVPTYYAPSADPLVGMVVNLLNDQVLKPVATAFGADIADVNQAFMDESKDHGGDPCEAGLLIVHPDGTCGVHPSPAGALLIARTIDLGVAPWTGKP